MTITNSQSCQCGNALPVSSGKARRPHEFCYDCKNQRIKDRDALISKRRSALSKAFLIHITKKLNRLVIGSDDAQTLFCTLYHEVRANPKQVPEVIRHAITHFTGYKPGVELNFAHCFGAYCRKYHGIKPAQIFKKKQNLEHENTVRDAHNERMEALSDEHNYQPGSYSAIEFLLAGFDDGLVAPEDKETAFETITRAANVKPRKDEKKVKLKSSAEVVAHQTFLRDLLIIEVQDRMNTGLASGQLIVNALKTKGFQGKDITDEMYLLDVEGILKDDAQGQFYIDESCLMY